MGSGELTRNIRIPAPRRLMVSVEIFKKQPPVLREAYCYVRSLWMVLRYPNPFLRHGKHAEKNTYCNYIISYIYILYIIPMFFVLKPVTEDIPGKPHILAETILGWNHTGSSVNRQGASCSSKAGGDRQPVILRKRRQRFLLQTLERDWHHRSLDLIRHGAFCASWLIHFWESTTKPVISVGSQHMS